MNTNNNLGGPGPVAHGDFSIIPLTSEGKEAIKRESFVSKEIDSKISQVGQAILKAVKFVLTPITMLIRGAQWLFDLSRPSPFGTKRAEQVREKHQLGKEIKRPPSALTDPTLARNTRSELPSPEELKLGLPPEPPMVNEEKLTPEDRLEPPPEDLKLGVPPEPPMVNEEKLTPEDRLEPLLKEFPDHRIGQAKFPPELDNFPKLKTFEGGEIISMHGAIEATIARLTSRNFVSKTKSIGQPTDDNKLISIREENPTAAPNQVRELQASFQFWKDAMRGTNYYFDGQLITGHIKRKNEKGEIQEEFNVGTPYHLSRVLKNRLDPYGEHTFNNATTLLQQGFILDAGTPIVNTIDPATEETNWVGIVGMHTATGPGIQVGIKEEGNDFVFHGNYVYTMISSLDPAKVLGYIAVRREVRISKEELSRRDWSTWQPNEETPKLQVRDFASPISPTIDDAQIRLNKAISNAESQAQFAPEKIDIRTKDLP